MQVEDEDQDFFWPGISIDLSRATLFDFSLSQCQIRSGSFMGTRFYGAHSFYRTSVTDRLLFLNAQFYAAGDFRYARFPHVTSFANSHFHNDATFAMATFAGQTRFDGAVFERQPAFSGAIAFEPTAEWPDDFPAWPDGISFREKSDQAGWYEIVRQESS